MIHSRLTPIRYCYNSAEYSVQDFLFICPVAIKYIPYKETPMPHTDSTIADLYKNLSDLPLRNTGPEPIYMVKEKKYIHIV